MKEQTQIDIMFFAFTGISAIIFTVGFIYIDSGEPFDLIISVLDKFGGSGGGIYHSQSLTEIKSDQQISYEKSIEDLKASDFLQTYILQPKEFIIPWK